MVQRFGTPPEADVQGAGGQTSLASPIFVHLADAYQKEGLLEDAIRICRDGLVTHPSCAGGRLILAKALLAAGALEDARREGEQILAHEPGHAGALQFLAAISARQEPVGQDGARRDDPLASPTLAALYAAQGHRTAAEAMYRQLGLAPPAVAGATPGQAILERLLALREGVRRLREEAPRRA